jgi:hypothetical protein
MNIQVEYILKDEYKDLNEKELNKEKKQLDDMTKFMLSVVALIPSIPVGMKHGFWWGAGTYVVGGFVAGVIIGEIYSLLFKCSKRESEFYDSRFYNRECSISKPKPLEIEPSID